MGQETILDGVSSNLVDTNKLLIENKALCEQLREKMLIFIIGSTQSRKPTSSFTGLIWPLRTDEYKKIAEVLLLKLMFIVSKGD